MRHPARAVAAALACAALVSSAPAPARAQRPPVPSWVDAAIDVPAPDASAAAPIEMLLHDVQWHVGGGGDDSGAARFTRIVLRVASGEEAARRAARLGIEMRAGETLAIHWIRRQRDGATTELPVPAPRPDDDGEEIVLGLRDARAGDVYDYAYTRTVPDAVRDGRFALRDRLGTPEGTRRLRFVATWPEGRTVRARVQGGGSTLVPVETPTSIRVEAEDVPPVATPRDAPRGWDAGAWIELSEHDGWEAIARWARAQSRWSVPDRAATGAAAPALEGDLAARTIGALRWAQGSDDLARDARAAHVVAILRTMQIDADVALVSRRDRARLAERLPSPAALDHAVVRATIDGEVRWLDPGRDDEREPLEALAPLTFGRALVLREGERELTEVPCPPPATPEVEIHEQFVVRDGLGDEVAATLRVETIMRREMAWAVRAELARGGAEGVGAMLATAYGNERVDPRPTAPLEIEERPDGSLRSVQQYELGRFWMRSPTRAGEGERDVGAWMVLGRLDAPVPDRPEDAPLGIVHPTWIEQRASVDGDTVWSIPEVDRTVRGTAFETTHRERAEGTHLEARTTYRTLASEVPPEGIAQHAADVARARDLVRVPLRALWVPVVEPFPPTWALVAIAVLLGALLVARILATRRREASASADEKQRGLSPPSGDPGP